MMDVIASWSGGKDSCFACYKALRQGYRVKYLLNFISRESKRCCFHALEGKLLRSQAELTGIPFVQKEVSSDMKVYEQEFKQAVSELKSKGIKGMVFGNVYLDERRSWVERICGDLEIKPIEPLWGTPPDKVVEEFIDLGFKAVVIASCVAKKLGEEFIGKLIDKDFIKELKKREICPCGENGEFHTLVVGGPMFEKEIKITKSEKILKEGFWKYWFLDIQKYKSV